MPTPHSISSHDSGWLGGRSSHLLIINCRHFELFSGHLAGRTASTQSLFEGHSRVSHVVTAHRSVTSLSLHVKTASQSTAVQSAFRYLGHSTSRHGLQSPDPDPDCPLMETRIDNKKIEAQIFERSILHAVNFFNFSRLYLGAFCSCVLRSLLLYLEQWVHDYTVLICHTIMVNGISFVPSHKKDL